jgi:molecular chaperone DnaJ
MPVERRRTHYDILGVERQAAAQQIRSQYRRLAKRYHPDLNPNNPQAARQFREVQAAYDVLSDDDKRREYDREIGIPANPESSIGRAGRDPNFAYDYDFYRPRYARRRRYPGPVHKPHQPRNAYSQYSVELTIGEFFKGAHRSLVIGYTFGCGNCRATGKIFGEDGAAHTCGRCEGWGFVVTYRRSDVYIPPGLLPDMSLRVEVSAEEEPSLFSAALSTHVYLTVRLKDSPPFEYTDQQLRTRTSVPQEVLTEGGDWQIPAPEGGEMITFKIPPCTASGTVLTLRRRGLKHGSSARRGNLLCTVTAA